jgi:hypothetical protein
MVYSIAYCLNALLLLQALKRVRNHLKMIHPFGFADENKNDEDSTTSSELSIEKTKIFIK